MELLQAFVEATRTLKVADAARAVGVSSSTMQRWRGYVARGRMPRPLSPRNRAAIEAFLGAEREELRAGAAADFVAGVHHATYHVMRTVNRLRQAQGLPPYPMPLEIQALLELQRQLEQERDTGKG